MICESRRTGQLGSMASLSQRISGYFRRSGEERRVFIVSLFLLPTLALAMNRVGFKRLRGWLEARTSPEFVTPTPETTERARQIAKMVNLAARLSPYKANCLKRSLALWWLLRRRHIDSELKIGVRKGKNGLEAHAWVEIGGVILNDAPSFVRTFLPFAGDIMAAYRFVN